MRITQTQFYKKLLGRIGENSAFAYLKKKGYKIIEKNYTTKIGEVDLIALYGDLLVFVEVKTRSSVASGRPADAVDFNKQRKYVLLATQYLQAHEKYRDSAVRFDVVEVLVENADNNIRLIKNAFMLM